ncbi:MAG: mannose-1-phosphate guanylyltransferase/mannose-6-phosphate isomerase [Desulfovibrio sp.]|nr:mannose-1-phosphate guanylyltransferase/mannose-6-phosphate isomerase [Desulfovibrio sp.]
MKFCPVILCGGSGTRLWPLSRSHYPKQFMDLGGHSLFSDTLIRIKDLPDMPPPLVICNEEQRFLAAAQLQAAYPGHAGRIILEPLGRNTAPAIAVAALTALHAETSPPFLLVLPSDHAIKNRTVFTQAVLKAVNIALNGRLVAFGIHPTKAETGYGWLERGDALETGYTLRRFVEKPCREDAEAMLTVGGYYWNSGMFLFAPQLYLQELQRYAPEIYAHSLAAFKGRRVDTDFIRLDHTAFSACPSDSIDYAVMEKTAYAAMVPLDVGWSDLGSWASLYETSDKDKNGNVRVGDIIAEDTADTYLHSSGRLIAALGIRDMIVVETGDAVLVADKERTEDVKKLVARLADEKRAEKDVHLRVLRPWGWYETLALGNRFQVKRIMVNPGAALSLQMHHHRAEHWVVVSGTGEIAVGDNVVLLHEDQSTYIPLGVKHRLCNPGRMPLEIIEVQSGAYLDEDDIVRFEDHYDRFIP